MSVPAATYTGNPRFAGPRAYWQQIAIGYGGGASIVRVADQVHVHQNFSGGYIDSFISLDTRFVAWSTTSWTLDHIFVDQVSYLNGLPTPYYFSCNIGYGPNPVTRQWCATLAYSGGTDYYFVDLPPAPTTYWQPQPV